MQKYAAIQGVVLTGLVAGVTLLIFQCRALTYKVEALEAARDKMEAAAPPAVSKPPPGELPPQVELMPPAAEPAPTRPADARPVSDSPVVEGPTLTPAQDQAVARAVDRILKEKYGHLPKLANPEDLEKTLEKELNLTASQKARIAELLKQKREEMRAVFEGDNPMGGSSIKKGMEIERRYEAAIKNELDANQQAKYDQLKKEGKIAQGLVVQIEADDKD